MLFPEGMGRGRNLQCLRIPFRRHRYTHTIVTSCYRGWVWILNPAYDNYTIKATECLPFITLRASTIFGLLSLYATCTFMYLLTADLTLILNKYKSTKKPNVTTNYSLEKNSNLPVTCCLFLSKFRLH